MRREFAPSGVLRAGINLGNPVIAQADPAGGEPRGVGPALARGLAARLGLPVAFTTYETAGRLADAVTQGAWDVAFLAIDPERAREIAFTDAYVHIEGTYMVRADSPLRHVGDVDREGVRVAVGLKTAYDLFLTRTLEHAQLVRSASSKTAIAQFVADGLDAVAGVRQPLVAAAQGMPGMRIMEDSFMVIRQAAAVPKGRPGPHAFLDRFIEDAKASGFVARALDESGVAATLAPPRR
ncbi:MAG TPA: transporter substrate-binding domain-containing protein [Usitatibacter sp.]|nr:transporter substrate-binding domain-containing protein [Usitatibacter sp.]